MDSNVFGQLDFRLAENTAKDATDFCILSNSLYARPVTESYYDWQMFQCPFDCLLNAAVDKNDSLIGTYCLHVQDAAPPETKVAWILDIMVSPKIQRQGVFRKLVDFGFENLKPHDAAAIVVMANDKADAAFVNGLGWNRINTFFTYFADPAQFIGKNKFLLEYEKIADFSPCEPIFAAQNINLFANARTVAYQNWRFIKNTRYDYDVFLASKNGAPFGYIVLKIFRDPVSGQAFGDIVDILWIEDDKVGLADLLRFSLIHFQEQSVNSVAMWLQTNTILDEIGVEVGFIRSQQKRFFCGKVLNKDFKHLEDAKKWFINMSDSEVY